MSSKLGRAIGISVVMGCAVSMALGASLYIYRNQLIYFSKTAFKEQDPSVITVVVDKGMRPMQIAQRLQDSGVILDANAFFRWLHYVAKQDETLKAGTYELSPTMSPERIVQELQSGRVPQLKVTFPEGLRKEEMAQILADAGIGTKDGNLKVMNDPKTVQAFGVPADVPGGIEGYLYPDTYQFNKGAVVEVVLKKMRSRVDEVIDARMQARMKEMGWSLHKVLTLASIVEKETGQPIERPRIAGLFLARLKQGMKLQTDPTVIYGIPNYDGDIRRRDLERPHAYNTYIIPGLPPGPIAQPGRAAIEAVLFPDNTDSLYFVAKGDSGLHEFCPTYTCHEAAVQKWQVEFYRNKKR